MTSLDQHKLYRNPGARISVFKDEFNEFYRDLTPDQVGILQSSHLLWDLLFFDKCRLSPRGNNFSDLKFQQKWASWLEEKWYPRCEKVDGEKKKKQMVSLLLKSLGEHQDKSAPSPWCWNGGGKLLEHVKKGDSVEQIMGLKNLADCCTEGATFSVGLSANLGSKKVDDFGSPNSLGSEENGSQPEVIEFDAGIYKERRFDDLPANISRLAPSELGYMKYYKNYFLYRMANRSLDQRIHEMPMRSNKRPKIEVVVHLFENVELHKWIGREPPIKKYKALIFNLIEMLIALSRHELIKMDITLKHTQDLYANLESEWNLSSEETDYLYSCDRTNRILELNREFPQFFSESPTDTAIEKILEQGPYDRTVEIVIPSSKKTVAELERNSHISALSIADVPGEEGLFKIINCKKSVELSRGDTFDILQNLSELIITESEMLA